MYAIVYLKEDDHPKAIVCKDKNEAVDRAIELMYAEEFCKECNESMEKELDREWKVESFDGVKRIYICRAFK